jgi:hypothetical protein
MSKKTDFSFCLAAMAMILLSAVLSIAQVTGGAVTGVVRDVNDAVIPTATVTLRNQATGQSFDTVTTDSGVYQFPNVPGGEYEITFEGSNFAPVKQTLRVALNQQSTVDAVLQVGGIGATVDVTAASEALIQTDSSQLGKNFETRQVTDLPIFGNQNALALLSPGVIAQPAGTAGSGGSVGGVRPRYNAFTVDGVDNNQPSVTGPATNVIQDAVQEFTLLTNNYNAEFGAASGGQFNTITKSGTNEFRGSGFVYTNSQELNATSTAEERRLNLAPTNSQFIREKPRFRNTRFGATVGGPIVRNQLFFFFAIQQERNSRAATGSSFL